MEIRIHYPILDISSNRLSYLILIFSHHSENKKKITLFSLKNNKPKFFHKHKLPY